MCETYPYFFYARPNRSVQTEELDCCSRETERRFGRVQYHLEESQFRAQCGKNVLYSKLAELKSKNEELEDNYAKLVKENVKVIGEVDAVKDELARRKLRMLVLRWNWG